MWRGYTGSKVELAGEREGCSKSYFLYYINSCKYLNAIRDNNEITGTRPRSSDNRKWKFFFSYTPHGLHTPYSSHTHRTHIAHSHATHNTLYTPFALWHFLSTSHYICNLLTLYRSTYLSKLSTRLFYNNLPRLLQILFCFVVFFLLICSTIVFIWFLSGRGIL